MFTPIGNPIPVAATVPLAASVTLSKGGYVMASPTTGNCSPGANATPGQLCVGALYPSEAVTASSVAGATTEIADQRPFWGIPASTVANDGFAATDIGSPIFVAGASTPGKLSNYNGKRSIAGLCLGLDPLGTGTPIQWTGIVASCVARSVIADNATVYASDKFALTANTNRAEQSLARGMACVGKVTQVRIKADGGFTAHDTNYWTITVAKRTAATPGTAVTLATSDLKVAFGNLTAFKYADLTLTSTTADLDLLEGDVITVTCTAQTTAAAMAVFTVEVIAKVG